MNCLKIKTNTMLARVAVFLLLSVIVSAGYIDLQQQQQQQLQPPQSSHLMQKKSFHTIGCLGDYDASKFERLDRICVECYQIYRKPEIQTTCRELCFKNDVFPACVDALLLSREQKELNEIVDQLLG